MSNTPPSMASAMDILWLFVTWRLAAYLCRHGCGCLLWPFVLGSTMGAMQVFDTPALCIAIIPLVYVSWYEAEVAWGYHGLPTWVDRMLGI